LPKEKKEEQLYLPVLDTLKQVFDRFYVAECQMYDSSSGLQRIPSSFIRNPHLEITAHGEFSEELKLRKFNYYMFEKLQAEQLHPDIMGYVVKNPSDKKTSPPETITVEVKYHALTIRDVMQAKLYEAIFDSKHTFLLSPTGMTGEKMEVVLKHDEFLRGHVMIGKCGEDGNTLRLDPRLADKIPKEFSKLCRL
jgi:hypothetical protein